MPDEAAVVRVRGWCMATAPVRMAAPAEASCIGLVTPAILAGAIAGRRTHASMARPLRRAPHRSTYGVGRGRRNQNRVPPAARGVQPIEPPQCSTVMRQK